MGRQRPNTRNGFTLVELVIVITIVGVCAGILMPFIVGAVKAYQAMEARNGLVAKGRLAMDRLAREVRHAVPNSLELVSDGSGNDGIQFVSSRYGTRYIDSGDNLGSAFSDFSRRFLVSSALNNGLYVLGTGLSGGGYLVIGNTAPGNLKVGCGATCSRVTLTGVAAASVLADGTDQGQILQFNAHTFPYDSPGRHALIADQSHEVGLSADGTLRWHRDNSLGDYDGNGDWSTGDPVLVDGVSRVAFAYQPGTAQSSGVLSIDLELSDGNESIRLYQEVHVRNTP